MSLITNTWESEGVHWLLWWNVLTLNNLPKEQSISVSNSQVTLHCEGKSGLEFSKKQGSGADTEIMEESFILDTQCVVLGSPVSTVNQENALQTYWQANLIEALSWSIFSSQVPRPCVKVTYTSQHRCDPLSRWKSLHQWDHQYRAKWQSVNDVFKGNKTTK